MKSSSFRALAFVVPVVLATLFALPSRGQTARDALEVVRGLHRADRKVIVAEALQLTDAESAGFWRLYGEYRVAMDRVGDDLVELVLEYADAFPDVPEDRAKRLLAKYTAMEREFAKTRASYLKRFGKILPATKALRLAQIENRLDLAVRLQLASAVPLVPSDGTR